MTATDHAAHVGSSLGAAFGAVGAGCVLLLIGLLMLRFPRFFELGGAAPGAELAAWGFVGVGLLLIVLGLIGLVHQLL